jgi:hypothetical protein
MDLLVPYIVEGRSELRYLSRVNCKTHSVFGLQNTLLTERINYSKSRSAWIRVCLVECTLDNIHTNFMCTNFKLKINNNKLLDNFFVCLLIVSFFSARFKKEQFIVMYSRDYFDITSCNHCIFSIAKTLNTYYIKRLSLYSILIYN